VYVIDARDGPVAVQRDGDQVEDGGRTAGDVEGYPRVAQLPTEEPACADLVDGSQRHHQRRHEQVGHRQRRDQVVGDRAQVTIDRDRRHDEDVADDGRQDDRSEHDQAHEQAHRADAGREASQVDCRSVVSDRRRRIFADVANSCRNRTAVGRSNASVGVSHRLTTEDRPVAKL